ncbi:acyl-CoA dehydrogenase [Actinomadura sp. LD22]|uniref:Acyl-CoA dehydrogenase n=1 Tax=Actinomadura physcomitrii TaxID=2650748 RepID=A0A6I4MDD8_9ACTN|nr:acyl-CoA dehydrogenase family protein [Actinomadura physcomitrii]MWA02910.1 acyl-CoA dehydrogenase [Actinomadura physcomitrii]
MKTTYPAPVEQFRRQVRTWLEENLPDGWFDGAEMPPEEREAFRASWTEKLHAAGWICASWPKEYGGRGLSPLENVVLHEEFARARAPMRADWFGDTLVGPTILRWGTDEQKAEFIPKILRGEITWCQGFSEPEAGSDLAGLRTRAEPRDGGWTINGRKIWTTRADEADYVFLLARTDPDAPRHRGISYLLVPMRQPGIEVRPIEQLDGATDFCEVVFTDAHAPEGCVVGGLNNGWKVAMTTLGFERGASATTGHRRFEKELRKIIGMARERGVHTDPVIRQRLAEQWTRVQIQRYHGLRTLADTVNGTREAAGLGQLNKMWWSETHRATMDLMMDILGPEGQILAGAAAEQGAWIPGVGMRNGRADYPAGVEQRAFLFSLSDTIGGGTAEIQRNIVAERLLGLPRG